MLVKLFISAVVGVGMLFPVAAPQQQQAVNVACCQMGAFEDCPCPDCPLCPDCCCCDDCPFRSVCCSENGCHAGEGFANHSKFFA